MKNYIEWTNKISKIWEKIWTRTSKVSQRKVSFWLMTDFVWTDIVTEHQKSRNGKCLFGSQLTLSEQKNSHCFKGLITEIVFLA